MALARSNGRGRPLKAPQDQDYRFHQIEGREGLAFAAISQIA